MVHTFLSRLGRLGLALVVTSSLLAACLGLVSFAAQPPNVARETAAPDLRGFGNPSLRSGQALEGLQAAPAVDFVAATLSPVKVTQGVSVTFTVNVVNTGELSVTLDTTTALAFSDGAGGEFSATLAAATNVPTSTAPSYVQVPLAFSPAAFPAGFAAGSYHPTLRLSGADGDSQPYSATVTSSGNSVQVVDYVTPTLPIAVAAGSLDPADVIQGEPVSFRLGLVNPNAMDITLGSGTTLAFTDSNGLVYAAPLLDAPVLPTGVTTTVAFRLTRVATETVPGVYTSTVALVGTDLGGQPVYQSTDLPTPVHAWENMPGLVEVPGSLMPTEPDRYSLHVFWVDLTNTLSCTVTLDMRSQVLLNTGHRSVYVAPLMNAISLRGGEQTRILFASSDLSAIPSRVYHPQLRLFGSAACGPSSISQWIESTGTTELVDQVPHGVGVGGGVPGGGWITQYGGVFPIGVMNGATESRQQLYSVQLLNRCDNEVCNNFYPLPDGTFRLDWPYAYVMPRETFLVNAYIQPTDTLTRSERFDLLVRTCTVPIVGGSFCGQRAISVWVVDRDGKVTIESLDPANTFIQRSAAGRVEIGARNPESGGASSPLTIVPTDTTRLTLRQGNTDVTGFFDMTGADPSAAIPPSATDLAVFTVTPSLTAPAGLVMLDAQITTQGTYPYFFRVGYGESPAGEIYHGPENIVLTGTVTATDFISPAHVYVVDALPLSLAADRLTPAVVAWDATGLTLTAQVSNASDLSFTIFPTSELGITFDPKAALRTGDAFTGTEPVGGLGFAQGFQSPRSFTLGKVGFDLLDCPSDMTLLAQVIAAAPDGGISNNVLGSMTFLVPAHAASRFFTPPFGLALQDGQSYYFSYQLYGGSCSVWSPWSPTDAYPGGQAYSWGASWEPISGDLDIELRSASPNDYSGMLVPGQPVNLPPHTAITLTFANTDTLAGKADGVYTPTLLLRGLFTHTVGTYDFHQHLDGSENPVMVDATPPTAQVEPIGGFSAFPSFVVGWSGSDNLSGLAGFDVQSRQGAGDAWRDWLTDTLALSATFTSPDGRLPYDFRVRATDRVGNPGAWSAAATGPYDAVAPTVAILGLLPYQAAAFTVGWNGSDATAGLAGFDVQVCEVAGGGSAAAGIEPSGGLALAPQDNRLKPLLQKGVNRVSEVAACPQWSVWLTGTSALTATFTGVDLTTYAFRARASDRAGNVSEWTPPVTTTVDAAAGSAALTPLAAWQLLNFAVTWLGADDGAGVVGYDLQSRAATGPWTDWLTGVAITGAIFSGSDGVAYGFRARVTDAAGNIGAWSQEVTATVDATPPSVTVGELSAVQQATDFAVAWSGSDATSGVATFDVQARSDGGDWADWLATTTAASATFTGADGLSYAFRARAADRAGNVGEWSAERATTVNLSAPAVDFVGATLAPVKITQGVPVTFAVNVVNTGELSVTLDTATALAFNDGAGGEFSATLAAATEVPTSTAPSYLQVPLVFAPAEFPAGFLAGSYHPTLRLSGADGDSQPYSATVTSSGNSVQVVDYVTPTLPIAVAAGSLDPADVIQGEPVSFRLGLVNPNAMDITLGSGTTLAFTDSNSLVYAAALLDAPILPTGVTTTVELRLTRVATETVPGVYTPTVALVGTDLGGFPVYQSTDLPDAVIVWEPTPGLVEAQGSLQPTLPDRYTGLLARIDVTNTLPCTVSLDARSRVMLTLDSQAMLSRNLNGTQVLPPGKRRPVYFASASLDNLPDAIYELYVTLFGINVCDGSVLRSAFKVSNTMQLIPVPPVGSFVGISPASLTLWLTQYGGAIPMEVAGGHQTLPEVQRLYSFELGNTCRLAEGCGSVIFMPDNTFQRLEPYTYLRTAEVYQNYIYIKPSEAMTRGVQYILGARNCTESASSGGGIGGAYCAGAGLAFYFVDRDAKERVVNFSGNDTFWVRGQPGSLHLDSINPETGGASSTLTVQDDLTLLRMHRAETDVSDAFASNISTPAVSITPQTTATLEFVVTPTLAAPLGPIELDAQVTTRGEYPYLIGPFVNCDLMRCAGLPYDGPSRIVMTGTVTATDFISPAHIYVVDALPLSLAADSLTPAAVAWDATSLTLTARVSNTSDLSFTIFPTSELEIPFRPIDNDLLMEIGAGLPVDSGSWGRGVAQSFVVTQPVRLGAATFETQLPPLTQALSVRVASSLSGGPDTARTLRQVTIDHPSYTLYETQAFTSPDLNVELQPNWTYWLIVELVGGESEMWAPSFGGDFYPAGELQQFRNGSWMADWGRDLKLRLARMEVYRGLLVTPLALSPGQAVTGTFVNTNTLPARADGIYTPTLLLRGLFTDTVGTYDFHQHLDGSGNPVMVDTTPPIAQVAPIGGFSDFPSFVVGWTGSDNISGIAGYDVQVREPGGAWTGWLTGTTALSATFASPDPRLPYEFRVRTADRTGNVSDWSTEVTGPNDATPPEVAMTALMVYNNAAFTVGWQGSDAVAGLARFDVQMQAGGNGWTDWLTTTSALTATFTGVDLTTYAFRTRATDRAGNVSEWTPLVTTTVDTSAPSALVDPLAEWQPETFAVSWAGSDILSGVTTFDVQTRVGDGDWSDWLPGAAVTASLFTGSDGQTYAFRVRAADAAGNVGAWSQEVTVIIDAIGPTAVVNGDGWWRPLIFDVSWSGSDDRSGVAYYNVQYFRYENNCYCWASWLAHTTATSATFTVTAGGFAGFIAQAVDGAGNVGAWSAQKWFQVDATPPTAAMTGLPSVQYTPTFTLAWSGSDGSGGSGIAVFDIEVKESAGDWTGWLTRVTSTTATFSGQDGQAYRFRARAIDSASNVGAWSQEVTTTVHVDSTPPTSTLSALPLYSIPYFTASWSGTDDLSGVASYQVQYRQCLCWSYDTCTLDQQSIWEQTCGDWADWLVWTPATSALFNENWQILRLRVRAKDLVDNIGEWSPEQIVFLDPIPPWGYIYELPFWSRRPLTVSWYLTDLVSGVATFAVQYRVAGGDWGTWVEGTTERSAAFSGEDGHTYEFRVRPTDLVGNVGEWSPARSTTVDATPPTAALNALPAFQATGIFTVAWSGTDATAGVANYDVEFSEDSGTWNDWQRSVAVTSTIFAGTDGHSYAFRARATDNAGNVSDWTTPVTTTVVTSAPPAAIITPTRGGASGSDLILAWSRPAGMAAFQVWRSATPYFTPGVGGSTLIGDETSANCTVGETTVTCTDAGALGSVGSYFYVVRTFNGAGLWSDSAGSAAFTFGITPGGP